MIRAGIGGWTFEPWRGSFYPPGLPHARELEFASQRLTTIEINGTFYRTQKPDTFRKWAAETPEGFVFSVKAPRYAVNKRHLAESGEAINRFIESGLGELQEKLGPVLWQFAPTKKFDETDLAAFLKLLPSELSGKPLRHALEVRHESFQCPRFIEMARDKGAAIVLADSEDYPLIDESTADFTYARLMKSREDEPAGYAKPGIDAWAKRGRDLSAGGRDVYIYFIDGAKEKAPVAAQAFLKSIETGT